MTDRATRKVELAKIVQSFNRQDHWDHPPKSSAEITKIARSTAPIAISPSCQSRSRKAPRQSQSRLSADRDRAKCRSRSRLRVDRNLVKHRADRSLSLNPVASLCSFFSQFDRIWWFFFLGFVCVSVLKNEWYYILIWQPRKCEKMWATSRKCVFYGIFKNTTKHQKIFFKMQQNTWKHFPFRKIAFLENRIFSENTFTRTKRSLSDS